MRKPKAWKYPRYALHPRVGDVWRMPSGSLRVVREIGYKDAMYFSIRRCSWTKRPYTVYGGRELYRAGGRLVKRGMILRRPIDKKMTDAINHKGASYPHNLTCKLAVGLP